MDLQTLQKQWQTLSLEVITGMAEWRLQHPRATFKEIETALDERLEQLRAKLLQEAALLSQARDWREGSEAPRCPECGTALEGHTLKVRHLQTHGNQSIALERQYGVCPPCGSGFFPPG
jgi:hypothetical protein